MPVINLNDLKTVRPERIKYESETITTEVVAGKTLRLETSPQGNEIASGTVPEGKAWLVRWVLSITETNAP